MKAHRRFKTIVGTLLFIMVVTVGCDWFDSDDGPCSPGNCSGHGTCMVTSSGDAYCDCDEGYCRTGDYECRSCNQNNVKPIIYLYPEQEMAVNVSFAAHDAAALTHTYPEYPEDGWQVVASPDGTLTDPATGRSYYALYWEGVKNDHIQFSTGFVVAGRETAAFLEEKLEILGLTAREANEFIIYWLPLLEPNAYNFIHFSTAQWSRAVPLAVTPQPDTWIRFLMIYAPLKAPFDILPQELVSPERRGFVLVEWGGRELTDECELPAEALLP